MRRTVFVNLATVSAVALFVLLALASAGGSLWAADDDKDIDYEAARANPVLRAALSENSPYTAKRDEGPPDAESLMHEAWIDKQVDYFVRDVHRKMGTLRAAVDRAEAARLEAVSAGAEAGAATSKWKEALKEAEDSSRSVRALIANVLADLRSHDRTKISISGHSKRKRFEDEMKLLSSEMKLADQAVADYFFRPTHVTSVFELREANMLDYLSRVEKIARAVRQAM